MPDPSVVVHRVTVHFEVEPPESYAAEDFRVLHVHRRKLTVDADPQPGPPDSRRRVTQVEIEYRAGDQVNYTTVVQAGDGTVPGADHIRLRPKQAAEARAQEIPAAEVRAGQTFAVLSHAPVRRSDMSTELQAGWHRSDCTWFYPV